MKLEDLASELKGKSILITGGSGFFGKNLCEALNLLNKKLDLGLSISAMARNPIVQEGVEFIQQDVTKPFQCDKHFDFIIHAATPVVSDESSFNQNIDIIVNGTFNTLAFAKKNNCKRVLLVSSGAVYGQQPADLAQLNEDYVIQETFFDFKSAYGTGKRISELQALDWADRTGYSVSIARCFAFSGRHLPVDQHLAIGNFIRDAIVSKSIKIKGDGSALRSYMDADDLVVWLMTILLRGKNKEIYNVGSDKELSIKDLANTIARIVPGTEVVVENSLPTSSKRNRYIPSIKKAQRELSLELSINLEESIKKMVEFNRGPK